MAQNNGIHRSPPSPTFTSDSEVTTLIPPYALDSPGPSSYDEDPKPFPHNCKSGINWKFAYEGFALLNHAVREASTLDQEPALTRKLYIDGLAYLVRGLSTELDGEELQQLKQALPFDIGSTGDHAGAVSSCETSTSDRRIAPRCPRRSITYAASTKATFAILLLAKIMLPYVRLLLLQAYRCDRKYRISERLLTNGVNAGGKSQIDTMSI
jgi:hypothetical protein